MRTYFKPREAYVSRRWNGCLSIGCDAVAVAQLYDTRPAVVLVLTLVSRKLSVVRLIRGRPSFVRVESKQVIEADFRRTTHGKAMSKNKTGENKRKERECKIAKY